MTVSDREKTVAPVDRHPMRLSLVLVAIAASGYCNCAAACSPSRQIDESGFVRHYVTRLPKNALGVMFSSSAGLPRASQFSLTSVQDTRSLVIRVTPVFGAHVVRLEPVGGFQAGARYQFRYIPSHGEWRHPDAVTVDVDERSVSTAGHYAIKLGPGNVLRAMTVPTSSGSCVEPRPAVIREMTFVTPPQLAPYREQLSFEFGPPAILRPRQSKRPLMISGWPGTPDLQRSPWDSGSWDLMSEYGGPRNAVRVACGGTNWRVRVGGAVSFPEVDATYRHVKSAEFDIGGKVDGACHHLEAVLNAVHGKPFVPAIRQACSTMSMVDPDETSSIGIAPAARDLDRWAWNLSFFYGMSATCNMVELGHLWRSGHLVDSVSVGRLAEALRQGLGTLHKADRDQALHSLAYLIVQLPSGSNAALTRILLAPSLPVIVDAFQQADMAQLDELALLIQWSGALPDRERARITAMTKGQSARAGHARVVLAAQSMRRHWRAIGCTDFGKEKLAQRIRFKFPSRTVDPGRLGYRPEATVRKLPRFGSFFTDDPAIGRATVDV